MGKVLHQRIRQSKFESVQQEALLNLLVAAGHIKGWLERRYAEHKITSGQYNVLRILKGTYPNGYCRSDIISRMLEPAPDVTRLIDRLVKTGLVRREQSLEDKRLSMTYITEAGLRVLDDLRPEVDRASQLIRGSLNDEECRVFSELCEKIYAPLLPELWQQETP